MVSVCAGTRLTRGECCDAPDFVPLFRNILEISQSGHRCHWGPSASLILGLELCIFGVTSRPLGLARLSCTPKAVVTACVVVNPSPTCSAPLPVCSLAASPSSPEPHAACATRQKPSSRMSGRKDPSSTRRSMSWTPATKSGKVCTSLTLRW
jgi:hypothetical protein